jgi:hypothetical protein
MARTNVATVEVVRTHEGAKAQRVPALEELRRAVLTYLLWEDSFYESGLGLAERIRELVPKVKPKAVADLAIQARDDMYLRHVPLFLCRELCRVKGAGPEVYRALYHVIQRADELGEFLALYWKEGRHPIAAAAKRALADAFTKFDAYQLAKYDRKGPVRLRDVMFLVHPKPIGGDCVQRFYAPKGDEQEAVWKALAEGTLVAPDTWEVALSAGKDKKVTFTRLLQENKLGSLAVLRNLRNMREAGVDDDLIRQRLERGTPRVLPFQYLAAAKHAPRFEASIEKAMLKSLEPIAKLTGRTLFVVDTSGSMDHSNVSVKSKMTRMDAGIALTVMARELCAYCDIVATAGDDGIRAHATAQIPNKYRGLSLVEQFSKPTVQRLGKGGIFLTQTMDWIADNIPARYDRVIVFTDEQDCELNDALSPSKARRLAPEGQNYIINVSTYKPGFGYGGGWTHINGWSERVFDYIRETEAAGVQAQRF